MKFDAVEESAAMPRTPLQSTWVKRWLRHTSEEEGRPEPRTGVGTPPDEPDANGDNGMETMKKMMMI